MTGTDEMVAFLHASLDRDEQVALAASVGPWRASPSMRSVYGPGSAVVNMPGPLPDWATYVVPPDSEGSEGIESADAEHIARWDPARVLAEVEAKRRILRTHARRHDCAWIQGIEGACSTIVFMVQPYAGQDGWREEWAL